MIYKLAESKLLSGFIYGDTPTQEYIYLPGSELDSSIPLAVYEKKNQRFDISLQQAIYLIETRSLHLVVHPYFGEKTV